MVIRKRKYNSFFAFLILCGIVHSQSFDSLCLQQQLVISSFKSNHISPPDFNKETYTEILDLFTDKVDARGLFILKSDKEVLQEIVNTTAGEDVACRLIERTYAIISKRVKQVDSILTVLESKPLVFSDKDTIRFLAKHGKRTLCVDTKELRGRIERRIKYDCLDQLIKPLKENEDVMKLSATELNSRQEAAKKKCIGRFKRYLEYYKSEFGLKHDIADAMSNAIALRCDPHSSYFNSYEKERWDEELSTEEFSFGFEASENEKGDIIIGALIPGGPAWKTNNVHVGDVILGFKFDGESAVELEFTEIEDFYTLFYQSKSKGLELTLRKKDNQIKKIKIQKEKIHSQENVMNSYVLTIEGRNYGYIPIPSFYSDDELDSRQGCANDVAKEIVKLKADSMQGLILDLRYNGGGSMKEAMGLAGIFIDEGPLSVFKTRGDKPRLLKDFNRGSIYDGPLLVLVNGASASASEFLTATLQDYNRAIIAGATTFGKGTAQNVIAADTNLYKAKGRRYYINPTMGYSKITIGKFYRVTALSHQGKGIEPDIHIPDMLEKLFMKESDEPYFLPADSVNKKVVYTKLNPFPVAELKELSRKRMETEKKFSEIKLLADSISASREKEEMIPLTLSAYKKFYDRGENLNERVEEILESDKGDLLKVNANSLNQKVSAFDGYQKKINEDAVERIKKDLILFEALSILNDLSTFKK